VRSGPGTARTILPFHIISARPSQQPRMDVIGGVESQKAWFGRGDTLHIDNIGADVWGESSIMAGVFQRWFSSTLHVG
jgi:hypothetical protein